MTKFPRFTILFILFLLAALLSGCAGGGTVANSWPGLTYDNERGTAYIAAGQYVYAIDATKGTELWRFSQEKETFFAAPALTDSGQVIVGSYNNRLYSLNPEAKGQLSKGSWPFTLATNRYIASPLIKNNSIYAPNADQNLYALDDQGNLQWKYHTDQSLWSTPASDGKTVYLPSMDHKIYALDAASGKLVWKTRDLGGAMVGTPTLSPDGILYIGNFDYEMLALRASDGEVIWRKPTDGWVWSGPELSGGKLYFGDLKGNFYAMDAQTGDVVWKNTPAEGSQDSIADRPVLMDGKVYYTTENGSLYVVDAETGAPVWNKAIGGQLYAMPVVTNDLIILAPMGLDQKLIALDKNGNQVWAFTPAKQG